MNKIFLLSPALTNGRRADALLTPRSAHPAAVRLEEGRLSIGEAFSFLSGLYFRGKSAYASHFGRSSDGASALVITSDRGLLPPHQTVTRADLEAFATSPIHPDNVRYTNPLQRSLEHLERGLSDSDLVVFLGSIATPKYTSVISSILGLRVVFPVAFLGRGDLSRGSLLLRSVASGEELTYRALECEAAPN